MWRPWMLLGVLPVLLLGCGTYYVLITPTSQTPSSKVESTLEIGAKELEKRIDDALDAPTPGADNPQRRSDEPPKTAVAPRPSQESCKSLTMSSWKLYLHKALVSRNCKNLVTSD